MSRKIFGSECRLVFHRIQSSPKNKNLEPGRHRMSHFLFVFSYLCFPDRARFRRRSRWSLSSGTGSSCSTSHSQTSGALLPCIRYRDDCSSLFATSNMSGYMLEAEVTTSDPDPQHLFTYIFPLKNLNAYTVLQKSHYVHLSFANYLVGQV